MDPVDAAAYQAATDAARSTLGEEAYAAAWAAGRTRPLDEAIAEALDPASGLDAQRRIGLTPREVEILRLLAAEQTNRVIAAALYVSVRTIEDHVARILRKLGVRTRSAAVSAAIEAGLIDATLSHDSGLIRPGTSRRTSSSRAPSQLSTTYRVPLETRSGTNRRTPLLGLGSICP